jgi:hypothetical protein
MVLSAAAQPREHEDNMKAMQAARGAAVRDGDRLTLHLRSGRAKSYVDVPYASCFSPDAKPDCLAHFYTLHAYDDVIGLFVLKVPCDECVYYIIVDHRSGDETYLEAEPHFSPIGDVAIELVYGEQRHYVNGPAVNVWRRVGGTFKREWWKPIVFDDSYSVLGWRSNSHVDIEAITQASWRKEGGTRRFSVVRRGATWHLENNPDASPVDQPD